MKRGYRFGALWLPGYTQYSSDVSNDAQALDVGLLANWVLGNFGSVAEVEAGLKGVEIWGSSAMVLSAPLHFSIHDASGTSVVLEFLKDNTQGLVQPNPVGMLTNAPPFAWRLCNIGNYVGLRSVDAASIKIGGITYAPPGHGSGMRGVPGDSTPPSRFVRTLFQKQFAKHPVNSTDASNLALHLLNTVDIPLGTSAPPLSIKTPPPPDDYTQWVVIKALTARTFSYRTAGNPTLMQIAFADLDLSKPGEAAYPLPAVATYFDITQQLSPV